MAAAASSLPGRLRLLYLPVRGRTENIRMMFAYSQVPYEDIVIPFDAFAKLKAQGRFPFRQLPLLQVIQSETVEETSKVSIAQSGSITRYLAPITGLMPENPLEAAICDSYFEAAQEFAKANPIVNIYTGETLEREQRLFLKKLPRMAENFSKILDKATQHHGPKSLLLGEKVTYADFNVFHYLEQSRLIHPQTIDAHPAILSYLERVSLLPGVREYLAKRPPLEQLGKALLPPPNKK